MDKTQVVDCDAFMPPLLLERPNETVEKHTFDYSNYTQTQDFNALLMSYPIHRHVHWLVNSSPIRTYSITPPILVDFADIVHQGK